MSIQINSLTIEETKFMVEASRETGVTSARAREIFGIAGKGPETAKDREVEKRVAAIRQNSGDWVSSMPISKGAFAFFAKPGLKCQKYTKEYEGAIQADAKKMYECHPWASTRSIVEAICMKYGFIYGAIAPAVGHAVAEARKV